MLLSTLSFIFSSVNSKIPLKKLPHRFRIPLMASVMMPTMLLGLPAILTYRNLPAGAPFTEHWLEAVGQTVPLALLLAVGVGSLAHFVITNLLLEPQNT